MMTGVTPGSDGGQGVGVTCVARGCKNENYGFSRKGTIKCFCCVLIYNM